MDGVASTTRGVRRGRQGDGVAAPDAGPSVSRKKIRIPAKNLQTKRGKKFDDYGTKMFRGRFGRSRSSTGAPGRSARLAGLPWKKNIFPKYKTHIIMEEEDREAIIRAIQERFPVLDRYLADLIVPLDKKISS